MPLVYVGVGSNEGDRFFNLLKGISLIRLKYAVVAVSSVYLTEALGFKGREFLNAVLLLSSDDNPFAMLEYFKMVEKALGREKSGYAPRPFDADLLLYENLTLTSPTLTIPHPRMWNRAFVLVPLHELFSSGFPNFGYGLKDFGTGRVKKVAERKALRIV